MNMFISKLITAVLLINMANCSSSASNTNSNTAALREVCQSFAKAICTKDTIAFYRVVDKESLTASMNEWIQDGKRITQEDLFFPFFFVYSPLKIRYQDLAEERNKVHFFADFKVDHKELINESNVKVNLVWIQNLVGAKPELIELVLKEGNEWKVTGARWRTL
jgi:hypothetical protein